MQYQICSTLQGDCNLILPLSVYGTKNETIRRNVRNTCRQFPAWRRSDCLNLRPNYRTVEPYKTLYSSAYKQWVWDTCRVEPNTGNWGASPTATVLYAGSDCADIIASGGQYAGCTTLREDCTWLLLLPLTRYPNHINEAVRKNVRKACGEQPKYTGQPLPAPSTIPQWKKDWKVNDCARLRTVYRKTPAIAATPIEQAVTYTLTYRQYIWDTCHLVANTGNWLARPTAAVP